MDEDQLLEYARSVISTEAHAVEQLTGALNQDFARVVTMILGLKQSGRMVVSGMGKAGYIAMKISATLASTGVPSYFLHPAEALHGDLGRYTSSDIALVLSNSGETDEVLQMLKLIKGIGCELVSITSKPDSTLGRHSDLVLHTGELTEVCPLGLAPTTSTTVMLALGDALALTVLKCQNFTREQFARYHPGGALGRSLMLVSDIMRRNEASPVVSQTQNTIDVIDHVSKAKGRPGAASVVDQTGHLVGFFTDGDLRRHLREGTDFLHQPIAEIMTRNPKTISADRLVEEAQHLLHEWKIDQVAVVDDCNRPIGLVDIQDILEL